MALSPASSADEVIAHLRAITSEEQKQGMLRYGIRIERVLGISHGDQRRIAKAIKRNHERAFALWASDLVEAQFIASLTADPARMTAEDARAWASTFDSWDVVDGVSDLFVDCTFWHELILEFADDEREFVRRTAFAMMAWASVHRMKEPDTTFVAFMPIIELHADDDRNFVKKAVSWALRSIGKRSALLHRTALETAGRLAERDNRTASWIGRDAIRDLNSEATQRRLAKKA